MTLDLSEGVQSILDRELSTGDYMSASDVVEIALRDLAAKREREEIIRAIREGVADAEAGRMYTVEETFRRIENAIPTSRSVDPSMTIELTDDLQKIVDQKLETGEYDSAAAVVAEALKALDERDQSLATLNEKQERDETIRAVRAGVAAVEAGETSTVEEVFDRLDRDFPDLKNEQ